MTKVSKSTPQAKSSHKASPKVSAPKATPTKNSHARVNSGAKRVNYASPNLNNSGNLPAGGAGGQ